MSKRDNLEELEQIAVFQWAAYYPVLRWMYAVPNGGKRSKAEAGKLKAQGVKSGVSDICLPLVRPPYHGLYIEMKRSDGKGRLTAEQREFGEAMQAHGYKWEVCQGTREAIQAIKNYANIGGV